MDQAKRLLNLLEILEKRTQSAEIKARIVETKAKLAKLGEAILPVPKAKKKKIIKEVEVEVDDE
jgi:hypothetical protein